MRRLYSLMFTSACAVVFSSIASSPLAQADAPPACNAWDIDYALAANVKITDTMMGAGDGTHASGPGRLRIRFENLNGAPGGIAKLVDYRLNDHVALSAKITLFEANVVAESVATTSPNACGVIADGTMNGKSLRWSALAGMHSDGWITCAGSLCGKFGAPPQGKSDVHTPPQNVSFKPFEFSEDRKTFTMDDSIVAKQSSPSQTSHLTLAGREMSRACVVAKPCP